MARWLFAVVAIGLGVCHSAMAGVPAGSEVEVVGKDQVPKALEEKDGLSVAQTQVKVTVPIPPEAETVVVTGKAGREKSGLVADFTWDDRSSTQVFARAGGDPSLPDGYLQLPWGVKLYIRPNVFFYGTPERKDRAIRGWQAFPPASEHVVRIEIRRRPHGAQVWVDSRFVQELPQKGRVTKVVLTVPRGGAVKEVRWHKEAAAKYLPLAVEDFARPALWAQAMGDMGWPNRMADARLSVATGPGAVEGIPFRVAPADRNIDVSGLGWLRCAVDDLVSFYWRRSTLEGLPESCILSVPQDTYIYAHILCAAEDDPAGRPEFNLRLTRYANSRGDAMADTPVRLPKAGQAAPNARQVGTVAYGPDNARRTVPLWLVRVPLKNGLIQDILREDEKKYCFRYPLPTARYLDLELMEPLEGVDESDPFPGDLQSIRHRSYVPPGRRTAVHVFGITLESSPAELVVRPSAAVNAFYAAENPALLAEVQPHETGRYEIAWDFADVDGKTAAAGKKELNCTAGKHETVPIPVTVGNGWYASRVRLRDAAGQDLVDHRGSFAMLPPDTRKAGPESPHGTWWFNWAHGGAKDAEHVGTLMQRAGLRHTMLSKDLPESAMAPYQVTTWCIPWKQPGAASIEAWVNGLETHIRETLKVCPSAATVMIYHESDGYGGRFPSEIWGETPAPLNEKNEAAWQNRINHMLPGLQMIREKFPDLKIQIGNCGNGCAMVAEMLRHGLPKAYFDYVAVEDLGQTFIPEKPALDSLQSAWYLRQTARQFGCANAQITGCYEWIGRMHMKLGLRTQAEWYIRDALHARAYGFRTIALGAIHDAGQGYFHTIWGNGGMCFRYPYMYPKPVYAAMATHTRVLDAARFERLVSTGALSLYALEFQREGQWIYALWTPRGCREATLTLASDADVTITDLYGRETNARGRELNLTVSTGAQYVTTKARIARVAAGKSWFPDDPPPQESALVDGMESLGRWLVSEDLKWMERTRGSNLPHRTRGKYDIREVVDPEKGKCLEFELKPEGQVWAMLYEHTFVKLKEPRPLPGPYQYVGVWVKGNSSWGEIIAQVAGSDGKAVLLTPDWPGTTNISFDGWNFIRLKLPEGPNWRGPVTLIGFVVSIPRQMLYGTEMAPVPDLKIRLKDACLF